MPSLLSRISRIAPNGDRPSESGPKATSQGDISPGATSRKGSGSMFWKSQGGGGGPWGNGPRGGGPWGGNRGSGGGSGPRGRGPQPPDFEELLRRGQDRFRRVLPGGFRTGTGIAIVVLGILVIWLASGFYRVLPDEVGVVLRFGAYNRTTQPGLNYHLPTPIESVLKPSVTRINRTETGFRSAGETTHAGTSRDLPQ